MCYINTDSFNVYIKTVDIYKNIAKDVKTRFDTSNDELNRPLSKGKNKKVVGLMKDKLSGKIMTTFVGLRPKTYNYLIDYGSKDKKAKGTKEGVIKVKLKIENYKNCLEVAQLEKKINYIRKNKIDIDRIKENH